MPVVVVLRAMPVVVVLSGPVVITPLYPLAAGILYFVYGKFYLHYAWAVQCTKGPSRRDDDADVDVKPAMPCSSDNGPSWR